MASEHLKVTVWNLEWQPARSKAAETIRRRVWQDNPDVVCLTETYADFLDRDGHVITAEADYGYPLVPGRRKVLLWSKMPWEQVDPLGHEALPPGRFIAGRTATPAGEISIIGICIPWEEAHFRTGRRNRARWEDHLAYLAALDPVLNGKNSKTLVIGDFNQRVPRKRTPANVYAVLEQAILRRLILATTGPIQPLDRLAIDHVAHTHDLEATHVEGISDRGPAGEKLSDHFGVHVCLSGT